ncbi:MAG: clostripain-related cysteine peptidase [Vicinamibacterales bacterium]
MVFMTSDVGLDASAYVDIGEMQKVGTHPGHLNVLVQFAARGTRPPKRYVVHEGRLEDVWTTRRARRNPGRPGVLADFLEWAVETHPAERYAVILWGHAYGLGFGRARDNALTLYELASVLHGFKALTGRKLDILGFDACAMGKLETAYQFNDTASYLVASQTAIPLTGWPYHRILEAIEQNVTMGARECASAMVEAFVESYRPPAVTLTATDLATGPAVATALDELARALKRVMGRPADGPRVRLAFKAATSGSEASLVDVIDLCNRLARLRIPDLAGPVAALRKVMAGAIVRHGSMDFTDVKAPPVKGLNGGGVYAPPAVNRGEWDEVEIREADYRRLKLMRNSAWADVMYSVSGYSTKRARSSRTPRA